MAKNIRRLADRLGAKVVGHVPDVGGGAFGAARLAAIVETLRSRLVPGQGRRAEPQLGAPPQSSDEQGDRTAAQPPGRAG